MSPKLRPRITRLNCCPGRVCDGNSLTLAESMTTETGDMARSRASMVPVRRFTCVLLRTQLKPLVSGCCPAVPSIMK